MRLAGGVVDDLRVDVLEALEHRQARTLVGAGDLAPDPLRGSGLVLQLCVLPDPCFVPRAVAECCDAPTSAARLALLLACGLARLAANHFVAST